MSIPEKSDMEFAGRVNGMGERDPAGSYVAVRIWELEHMAWRRRIISVSQAETLGRDLLRAT
jgi:deferrochelatase/peroxidase EfeB